jgi:putative CocE/NonD family hydrolase
MGVFQVGRGMRWAHLGAVFLSIVVLSGCLSGTGTQKDVPAPVQIQGKQPPAAGQQPVPEGEYKFDSNRPQVLVPGPYEILPFEHIFLQSELDGVDIEVGIFRPDVPDGMKAPVILDAGPYYHDDGSHMDSALGGFNVQNFVPWGYTFAMVAVRGTGLSGGCMDLMGRDEAADLSQAITWLGEQPWSNGRVGMIGKSYDGSTPWIAASTGNPYLKTIVPVSGVPDVYELMFRNGTSEIRGSFLLNALYYSFAVPQQPPRVQDGPETQAMVARHTVEGAACPDHVVGLEAAAHAGVLGGRDPTGYWTERNLKPMVEEHYKGSVFMIQGLQDWNVDPALNLPWADRLNQSGLFVHQMLGQWGHQHPYENPNGNNKRWDYAQILLNWFDYFLMEKTTVQLGPAVQVLDATTRRWHYDDSWPPHDTNVTKLYLASGERLEAEPEASSSSVLLLPTPVSNVQSQFRQLPAPLDKAMGADFALAVTDKDLHISGLPRVHVTVTPGGPTGFIAAYLYDVNGTTETRIGHTQMNLFFADGTDQMRAPLTPNVPLLAKMEIQPMDAIVKAGHKLVLRVWQYRDDANGDAVQGRMPLLPQPPVTLNFGGSTTAVLELPVIERGDEYFFQPPQPPAQ